MSVELTNMVMVYDPKKDAVLVEHRRKSWCGITFPGGHVEKGESFYDSAVREIREETGLEIRNLKSCGVMHWCNKTTGDQYIVFLYKTSDYSGTLIDGTEEGEVFWTNRGELPSMDLSNNFGEHLPLFTEDKYSEAFGLWDDNASDPIIYK